MNFTANSDLIAVVLMGSDGHPELSLSKRLFDAVTGQNLAAATDLLGLGASPNQVIEVNEGFCRTCTTALYFACEVKNVSLVKLLLDWGANPNIEYNQNCVVGWKTTACLIASFPSVEIARMLLEAGANPNVIQAQGEDSRWEQSTLEIARGNVDLEKLLRSYGAN